MNFLKIEQSGFFGIFIPGAFLFINIIYSISIFIYGQDLNSLNLQPGLSVEMGFIGFVLTIILGFILRMLPYEYSDWFRANKFPYFNYYFSQNWDKFPKDFKDFFNKYAQSNYPDLPELSDGKNRLSGINIEMAKFIINNLKIKIFKDCPDLKNEILFHEGASRLAVGTLYALVLSVLFIISAIILNWKPFPEYGFDVFLISFYFTLILVIYKRLPSLRGKEVRTILEAYAQV